MRTYSQTQTHTIDIHTYIHTHRYTSQTHTHAYTDLHIRDTYMYTHSHRHTYHRHTHMHTHTHTHTFILSHVRLFFTPRTAAHQAPLSMGCSRQEYWSGLPCSPPGDLLDIGIKTVSLVSPELAGRFFSRLSWGRRW